MNYDYNNYNITEVDVDSVVTNLFYNTPKDPKSIQLIFENKDDGLVNLKDIFDLLVKTFITGMIIKFGSNEPTISLNNINNINIKIINAFFNSIGFNVHYKIEKCLNYDDICSYISNEELPSLDENNSIDETTKNFEKLEDYYIKLISKENDKYYIWFSIL